MKVLVYVTFAANTPHFETELELIQLHLDRGDDVTVVACDAELLSCDINWEHRREACAICTGRRRAGLALLSHRVRVLPHLDLDAAQRAESAAHARAWEPRAELAAIRVDNFDIGYGTLSSLVSWQREPALDLARHDAFVKRLFLSALGVYRTAQNHLDRGRYDRVYVYNGRYALMRAVARACESRGVEYCTHEKGSTLQRYGLWRNATVHDLANTGRLIEQAWEHAGGDPAERERLAREFYLDRVRGISRTWIAFTADHASGSMPEDWRDDRRNVAIYISSEDEFVAIGDSWRNPLYASQQQGLERIAASTESWRDVHLYVRVHPNLKGLNNSQTGQLASLRFPHVTVIPAESPISSYAMLMRCDAALTFGSTIGIEAVYWGKPSVLAGQCMYRALGATYNPESHEALVALLGRELAPSPVEPALKYGFYWQTFGEAFRYYEPTGIYSGRYRGVAIRPGAVRRALEARGPGRALAERRHAARARRTRAMLGLDPEADPA